MASCHIHSIGVHFAIFSPHMTSMKKKLFLLFPLLAVAALAIFWQTIFAHLLTYSTKQYTLNRFGVELESESVKKEEGFWVFESLSIKRHDVSLTAEQLKLKFDWSPLQHTLAITMKVNDSEIAIGEKTADLAALFSDILPKSLPFWMLNVESVCEIENGRASWVVDHDQRESAAFHLALMGNDQRQEMELSVWLDEEEFGKNAFRLQLENELGKGIGSVLTFQQVECGKIARGFEAAGHPLKGWEIRSGMIDGEVRVSWPEQHAPYATGKANVLDLVFEQPAKKMAGQVKEAVLDIHMEHVKGQIPSLEGKVEFIQGTSLAFHRQGEPFWKIDQLSGGIYFRPERTVMIDISGECKHELCDFHLTLDGAAQLVDKQNASLEVAARLSSEKGRETVARFVAEQLGPQKHQAELTFENVGPDEFSFVQEALARYAPDWNAFHIHRGSLNAKGFASMIGWQLTDLDIQQVEVNTLHFDIESLDLSASVNRVFGDFSIHLLEEDPLKTIDADFHISDGQLISRNLTGSVCCLDNVKTELSVRQGVVQKSEIQGEFAGLKGIVAIDWMARDRIVQVNFNGPSERLAPFLPVHFRSSFLRSFSSDDLEIAADVGYQNDRLSVEGKARLAQQEVAFGFQLEKSSEKLWKSWPADELAASYWENVGQEVMQSVLPPIASPTVLYESNWIRSEKGIAGLVLRKGWFEINEMDLNRFAAPFLFPSDQMAIFGTGSFRGGFDQNILTVEYEADRFVMENKFIRIETDHIGSRDKVYAAHYFDFKEGAHYGSIPMRGAHYFEKNTGLTFSPTDAQVTLEGKKVHLSQIVTECMGIQMAGEIDIDFGEPDDDIFDLEIRVQQVKGGMRNAQKLMAKFDPDLWLYQIPVDGDIGLREEGAFFKFSFYPGDFTLDAVLKGKVQDGSISMDEERSSGLRDLQLQFGYDHHNHLFEISHLQAEILWDNQPTGYSLYGDHIRFDDLEEGRSSFDFWLGDHTRDLIRFVGKTQKEHIDDDHSFIAVHIDHHLTHAGNVHPTSFLLRLNNWTEVDEFQLGMQIDLDSLLSDLRALSHSAIGAALTKFGKEVQSIRQAGGVLDVHYSYDKQSNEIAYRVLGKAIEWHYWKAQSIELLGKKNDSQWTIERFQWDDKVASGVFSPENEGWKVDRLRFKNKDIVSVNLNGFLSPQKKRLDGRVQEIQIDLAQMSGTPEIELFTTANDPHGTLTGYGNINFEWGVGRTPWRIEAILDVALTKWDAKGMHFDDAQNASCHFISDQGMTMRKLQTKVLDPENRAALAQIDIEKIQYDFTTGEILFDELKFEAPSHHLPKFSEQLEQSFPKFVTPGMGETIRNCKLEGLFKGVMQYEMTPPYTAVRLELEDGIYNFLNTQHALKNFVMDYDPFEFTVTSGYQLSGNDVWLYARSSSPSLAYGELVLTDEAPQQMRKHAPAEALYFDWENDQVTGISFTRIVGNFQGLQMQLEKDPTQAPSKEALYLVGSVGIHGLRAKGFFPQQMAEKFVAWRVGEGYELQGKWRFLKNHSESYGDKLHFVGKLKGDRFRIKGYQFDTLQAHMEYTPTAIRINDLVVNDSCGVLKTDRIDILKTDLGSWAFAMPLMTVSQFRPSLLQEEGMPRPTMRKPMVIQELVLEKTQGNLSDARTMIGKGSFFFSNRSKKLLQNTIFQIPSDIISRIGLDPAVMTPVTGTVQYEIHDGRIYLTKFKDIYSDAKLSKFYLASTNPSTVDFDGGLNVQVKMKQYNLIFKLAELFTFNIQGNLKKPVYSIQKQQSETAVNR